MQMCGIAGMVGLPNIAQEKMLLTMKRRGPDGDGVYSEPAVTFLHSRLAIIDPENGQQPMALSWDGETYIICYNGELYNTLELRRELEKLGHQFTNRSDTEVLLHAYAQWQEQCLHKLNGIFAFAVWHQREQRLFLARDPMGVKPLFYMEHQGGFLFASEIKTILAYPTVTARLDATGVGELLLLGPGRTPGSGVLQGMRELQPGW
jgi:asparagine synthase (glutamine-hydrolysing)